MTSTTIKKTHDAKSLSDFLTITCGVHAHLSAAAEPRTSPSDRLLASHHAPHLAGVLRPQRPQHLKLVMLIGGRFEVPKEKPVFLAATAVPFRPP